MANYNLGPLQSNPETFNDLSLTGLDPTDVFEFSLANNGQVNLNLHNLSAGDDADLLLFEDSNGNGVLDSSDEEVDYSELAGDVDEFIDYNATAGTYFAEVVAYDAGEDGIIYYDLDLSATSVNNTPDVPHTYQPFDANEVFNLNSNPDADHIIYLDFDGHITTGTNWNTDEEYDYGDEIITPAYTIDGNTSNFSNSERRSIYQIWQRVAEDFIPFDVNVTTAQPSDQELINTGGNDSQWGIRVVIGGNALLNDGTLGEAYDLNSFNDNTPTFVFSAEHDDKEKGVAETISHEVGHTLGLEHHGDNRYEAPDNRHEYYEGHGSGETGWAPIMGNSDTHNLTQWSRGDYTYANNQQDDLGIITGGRNGFGYRQDDYGNNRNSAQDLFFNHNGEVETYGIVERNTDVDWFGFNSTTGNIELNINPFDPGPNLDILAKLYNNSGQEIESSNPIGSISASFNLDLDPGQYYLSIEGTGQGNLTTGYSDYGSLGQYSITGEIA